MKENLLIFKGIKRKRFQGVVKRHGFGGVGQSTHGQHNRLRAPGSVGNIFLSIKSIQRNAYGWKNGRRNVKVQNLRVLKVVAEKICC